MWYWEVYVLNLLDDHVHSFRSSIGFEHESQVITVLKAKLESCFITEFLGHTSFEIKEVFILYKPHTLEV